MNYKMMGRFIGRILLVEAVFMIPSLIIGLVKQEDMACVGFASSMCITLLISLLLLILCKGSRRVFKAREGLVCVGVSWIVMSLLGALPFYISREIPFYLDALFETVSGFTTTGASILAEVESLSMSILYWRSFTHWLGGMGVLVFVLAVGASGESSKGFTMHLLRAESPGPQVGKLVPKMKKTAEILYVIYILLTLVDIVFLLFGGMSLFEAVCTAFGTAGTGGFGIKNDSIAGYSPYIQNVCTVFMLLFGINFSCYYMLLLRQFKSVLKDEELRPSFSKAIILGLMVIGASAGSTGGGFKCARVLIVVKGLRRNLRRAISPQKVQVVRINDHMVDEKVLENTNAYLSAYVIILFVSVIIVSLEKFSVMTSLTAVLSCFNNIGPGLEAVGPTCNFGDFTWLSKVVLIMDMLAGRLEIFPILILFSRSTWGRLKG